VQVIPDAEPGEGGLLHPLTSQPGRTGTTHRLAGPVGVPQLRRTAPGAPAGLTCRAPSRNSTPSRKASAAGSGPSTLTAGVRRV